MISNKKAIFTIMLVIVSLLTFSILVSCTATVEYKVDFIVDGEVYHTINTAGETTIAMPQNPTKTGYTFLGWSGTDLIGRTQNVVINTGSTGDREFTANWEAKEYKITYNYNDGVTTQTEQPVTYDSPYTLITALKILTISNYY